MDTGQHISLVDPVDSSVSVDARSVSIVWGSDWVVPIRWRTGQDSTQRAVVPCTHRCL